MAEGILRHKAEKHGLKLKIDSAGTGRWHAGHPPDARAIRTAKAHGIDISKLVARQITENDFEIFDHILVADAEVYDGVVDLALNRDHKLKVEYIMNLVHPDLNMPVPDPYLGGMDGFEHVYALLDKACDEILKVYGIGK
jgi:protein-tyrosine phosphatase